MKTGFFIFAFSTIALLSTSYFFWKKKSNNITPQLDENYKKELIDKLIIAFADEWMASYQYWVAAKLVQDAKTPKIAAELTEHSQDEMRHANLIAKHLIELGGDFRMFPQDWHKIGNCHYDSITDVHAISVLKENIKGEQCAIDFYQDLLNMSKEKDKRTYDIVLEIFNDEVKHKQDLEKLL
ncbi:MAG: ferritin-like domain-containing protein [bacterium]